MKKLIIIPVFAALAGCQALDGALRFVVEACVEKGISKSGEF
jgi:hypothetical protein